MDYVLNDSVLCFYSNNKKNITTIIEKNKTININIGCLKFLKKNCSYYGNSYNIQREIIKEIFNYSIKTPIIVSEYKNIIFFPTSSPSSNNCIWISYNNVDRYIKDGNNTKIYFKGGKILNYKVNYNIIDNQITRCIKIEKYLSSKKNINCY